MTEQNEQSPPLPPAPAIGAVGNPEPVPPRTPEHFVCLRGPCRHYWHLVTMAHAGNPETTWQELGMERAPRKHWHTCTRSGQETSLTDDNVYECNQWDPMPEDQHSQREYRREQYFKRQQKDEQSK